MMVIINGHNFKRNTVIEIGKFVILWNLFENNNCRNDCQPEILVEIGNGQETSEAFQLFARALKNRAELFDVDDFEYVRNHLAMGRGLTPQQRKLVFAFMNSGGMGSVAGGLLAFYRIRNNMFHGLKEWSDLDNQIELFLSMNKVLEEIL